MPISKIYSSVYIMQIEITERQLLSLLKYHPELHPIAVTDKRRKVLRFSMPEICRILEYEFVTLQNQLQLRIHNAFVHLDAEKELARLQSGFVDYLGKFTFGAGFGIRFEELVAIVNKIKNLAESANISFFNN